MKLKTSAKPEHSFKHKESAKQNAVLCGPEKTDQRSRLPERMALNTEPFLSRVSTDTAWQLLQNHGSLQQSNSASCKKKNKRHSNTLEQNALNASHSEKNLLENSNKNISSCTVKWGIIPLVFLLLYAFTLICNQVIPQQFWRKKSRACVWICIF